MDIGLNSFFVAMAGVFVVFTVVLLVFYLVASFARYKYLKVRSYENAWMAFIPFANIWAVVEATYGRRDKINIYGWDAPALVLKLWPIVTYVLALVINAVPLIGNILSLVLYVLNLAVMLMIYRDIMETLEKPQEMVVSVMVVIFNIVSYIMILVAANEFEAGSQNWETEYRVLGSQSKVDGPLSFMNGNK